MRNHYWSLTPCHRLERIENELGDLASDEVLLRFHYCGLCGSDMSAYEGRRRRDKAMPLGHEFVAKVEAVGSNVTTFSAGDIVVSDLNYRCGVCAACRRKESHLCEVGQKGAFSNRGFAERAIIHASYLVVVDACEPKPKHAFAEPLSCVLHALKKAAPTPDDTILILGAGSLGSCMALALMDRNASALFYDTNTSRLKAAVEASPGFAAWDKNQTPDIVVDLSGSLHGLRCAVESVRRGGRVVSMSHLDGHGAADFLLPQLTRKDVWFTVSYLNGEKSSVEEAVRIIERTDDRHFDALSELVQEDRLPTAFAERRRSPANKTIIDLVASAF